MKDIDDKVIYVGKAINLYNRVSQYFLRPQTGKVLAMVNNVDHFETILTKTDKEAFLLEENLIHSYYPRYNILLKDGKHYPFIALKKKGDPYLKIARNEKDKNYYYFGPYSTSSYAYKIINLLNKLFPTRKCKNMPSTPCLYFHLGQCLAPCINKIDENEYAKLNEKIRSFLNGSDTQISKSIKEKMIECSNNCDFEKAQEYKEILTAIEHVLSIQGVEKTDHIFQDVFSYIVKDGYISIALMLYRNGILLGKDSFIVELFGDENEQVIELILSYYQSHPLPEQILANIANLKENFESIYDFSKVISISKGKQLELIEIANMNAKQALDNHFISARLTDKDNDLLIELGNRLSIKTPYRIELFDNSHIQGDAPIGALVVFINGEPCKKMYRKYNIEQTNKRDDVASMKEVMFRRYKRLKDNNDSFPDLILLDGGLTQIHAGVEIIEQLGLSIPVFGLYKNNKHSTEGIMDKNGKTYPLKDNKNLFFMLVRMQDEVHRYAISVHHQKRSKMFTKSILDDISGLGDKRKELIRSHYDNIDALKRASIDELSQLVPHDVAIKIKEKLDNNE